MNRVEVFEVDGINNIEHCVNSYCSSRNLKPLSISVSYCERKISWVVALVVEEKEGEE